MEREFYEREEERLSAEDGVGIERWESTLRSTIARVLSITHLPFVHIHVVKHNRVCFVTNVFEFVIEGELRSTIVCALSITHLPSVLHPNAVPSRFTHLQS